MNRYEKLFLSHSSSDKIYGDAIVLLLMKIGLNTEQILYSSNPTCGIPIGKDIYEYLRETIYDGAYMVYLLSDHYYESIACMNEMGAAWMRQNDFILLATPTFDYQNDKFQKGVANPQSLAVSMNNMVLMRQFIEHIKELFGIEVDSIQTEAALKEYFKTLDEIDRKDEGKKGKEKEDKSIIKGLETIVKNKPRKDSEFIELGRELWTKNQNYPAAIQQYLYAILINENCEAAYAHIIETAVIAREYSDGWKICKEAIKRFPKSAKILGSRGYLECAERKYEAAIKDCTEAIEIKKNRWYSNTRGRALWGINKVYEALADFHEAHRLDSQYSPAIQNIKILCLQIGIDNLIDVALQKKQESNYKLCQILLECVLIADESNEKAKKELIRLKEN